MHDPIAMAASEGVSLECASSNTFGPEAVEVNRSRFG
jgi:hypothetical protein